MSRLEQRLGRPVASEVGSIAGDRSRGAGIETRWADWKATGHQQDARIHTQMTAFGVIVIIAGMCAAVWGLFF